MQVCYPLSYPKLLPINLFPFLLEVNLVREVIIGVLRCVDPSSGADEGPRASIHYQREAEVDGGIGAGRPDAAELDHAEHITGLSGDAASGGGEAADDGLGGLVEGGVNVALQDWASEWGREVISSGHHSGTEHVPGSGRRDVPYTSLLYCTVHLTFASVQPILFF